jgi:hypothetical protein
MLSSGTLPSCNDPYGVSDDALSDPGVIASISSFPPFNSPISGTKLPLLTFTPTSSTTAERQYDEPEQAAATPHISPSYLIPLPLFRTPLVLVIFPSSNIKTKIFSFSPFSLSAFLRSASQ